MVLIYIVICLALLVFIMSSIAPKSYKVERKIKIDRPLEEVYKYLHLLRNQDHWAKWYRLDPEMKKEYKGEDGKIGFQSAWESDHKKVGAGQQTITSLEDNKAIYTKLEFYKPFKSESDAYIKTEKVNEETTEVFWGFTGEMNPPMNMMLLFMNMEKQVGSDFEEGLARLKEVLEGNRKLKMEN